MILQEPKVEFIELERVFTTDDSQGQGQETHMCGGTSFQPEEDKCSKDPSMF